MGISTSCYSVRKKKQGPVQADIFAFLTTGPNSVVAPIHPKAMPVILTTSEEIDTWMKRQAEIETATSPARSNLILLPQPEAEAEPQLL